MSKMTISEEGLRMIKQLEGFSAVAYRCPAGVWTIGYGHTSDVKEGQRISVDDAESWLKFDVAHVEKYLNEMNINFRQEQFDALVSFIFNIGTIAFSNSRIRKRLVFDDDDERIAFEIIRWVHGKGKVLSGLVKRRVMEANMFLGYEMFYVREDGLIDCK